MRRNKQAIGVTSARETNQVCCGSLPNESNGATLPLIFTANSTCGYHAVDEITSAILDHDRPLSNQRHHSKPMS